MKHKFLLLAVFCLWCVGSNAAILQVDGGVLIGASGVEVGGVFYDVTFLDGSCDSLFNGCDSSEFAFSKADDAEIAAWALLSQVFVDSAAGNFNSLLDPIVGCTFDINCLTRIPYSSGGGFVDEFVAVNATDVPDFVFDETIAANNTTAVFINANVAGFSRVSVPEPGSFGLLLLGMVGLAALRRRAW